MLRRATPFVLLAPKKTNFPDVPDLTQHSKPLYEKAEMGKCFDTAVLEPSVIPTKFLQKGLFRLPIPKLEDTCRRYLEQVRPLLTEKDYRDVTDIVQRFKGDVGPVLQKQLVEKDNANLHTSYLAADWFDLYLRDRQPLPLNYNPLIVARGDPDKTDGLTRATFWIASSLRWYKMYRADTLKPEVFYFCPKNHYCRKPWFQRLIRTVPATYAAKALAIGSQFMAFPLDMSQYDNLFNSTRIPGKGVDKIQGVSFAPHITVNYRGHQFIVNVADEATGDPLPEEQIYARLKAIVDTAVAPAEMDMGVLTADNRDAWADTRTALRRLGQNAASLDLIDSSLFVLDLDMDTEMQFSKTPSESTKHMLCAAQNRWWDKSFSVIVSKDGCLGVNFEHAWGDGVGVLRYTVDTFNDSISRKAASMNRGVAPTEPVKQLRWEHPEGFKLVHENAKAELEKQIKRCDFFCCGLDFMGKKDPMFKNKVKPDPFMQVAMQVAWWRLNQSTVSTYESASTAAFKHGRTECIRSASMESQAFAIALDKKDLPEVEKALLLHKACARHAAVAKDAKMGQGVDRHLFGLRKINEANGELHDIFTHRSYKEFGSNMISTSSLYSEALAGGGFGPVSPGYGVGYAAGDDMMMFNISSWNVDGPRHSSEEFARAIYQSATDMKALLVKYPTDEKLKAKRE